MIERNVARDGQESLALYSPCLRYRYGLRRIWDPTAPEILFVMLNPSTATEERNDPTIERCQRRAVRLGFGGVRIANLFAWRATRPADLRRAADPVGSETDALLRDWSDGVAVTIAAWGVHGTLRDRASQVAPLLRGDVRHLGLTRDGHPRHPLYVRNDAPLLRFVLPQESSSETADA
ncbi:DUF1643 domain-containing protein [Citreimonas salinaria]|uniref:DUF1643 domain-containing protein n=1 Tax=Citreimonas salinaria TaxID=321339 RepID=A0A1H3M866_9RHOB|nr:DUF1643 domain-containing protein [Citreimonas salinaria]SDY72803.1 hypothetical protein SAMN05444340_11616 [Citreimonas salinaria]